MSPGGGSFSDPDGTRGRAPRRSLWNPFFDRVLAEDPPLGAEELRMIIALARLVFGFNEVERRLGIDHVLRTAGLHGRSLHRVVGRLVARGLVEVEWGSPGRGTPTLWRLLREAPYASEEETSFENSAAASAEEPAENSAKTSAHERPLIGEEKELTTTYPGVEELEHLGLTPRQRDEVLKADPDLVSGWLAAAQAIGVRNRAALFWAGIRSGEPPSRGDSRHELARAYVGQGGWPTGSRWVRGTHGGTYVQDPLGRDEPSYSVPWGRPTLDQIQAACESPADAMRA